MVAVSVVLVVALVSLVVVLNGFVVVEVLVVDGVAIGAVSVAVTGDTFVVVMELPIVVSVACAGLAIVDRVVVVVAVDGIVVFDEVAFAILSLAVI